MGNIGSSLLLLLVALFVLWLAVTGRINAIPDAWNMILHGDSQATSGTQQVSLPALSIPSLPVLNTANVISRT